ncbi:MAG TPA: SDR family oxidoreductase [Solirubrobacteraceae bacterium]|nr:SDR family oxidoreductase [Solirubrobacteraceae bacterium]
MARFQLEGATVLLTGASRGIGPHIATALARRGARIALVARNAAGLASTEKLVTEAGGQALVLPADITAPADRHALLERAESELGPIDVLVNNAGGDPQRQFHNLTEQEIQGILDLNLTSAVILSRLVLPGMLGRQHGHIVNISSMAGRTGFPYTESYAAAKDGLIGFTRVLRADYRSQGVSGSTLILGPVGEAGVGARTAQEVGLKLPPVGLVSPAKVGAQTVRAITRDKAELAVLPGPGRAMRAIMDRFPGLGPSMNRLARVDRTMITVAEYREREARRVEHLTTG